MPNPRPLQRQDLRHAVHPDLPSPHFARSLKKGQLYDLVISKPLPYCMREHKLKTNQPNFKDVFLQLRSSPAAVTPGPGGLT